MGGYDIFYSVSINKRWTTPVNIGSPINNNSDNTFYYPIGNGKRAYVSRFGKNGESEDIYMLSVKSNIPEF
jgi:hypothetical protein